MLKQRILTALVLVPLVVAGVLGLGTWSLGGVFAAVILLAGWEWAALAGLAPTPARIGYVAVLVLLMAVGVPLLVAPAGALWLPGLALVGWLLAAVWIVTYQRCAGTRPGTPGAWPLRLIGVVVLVPPWIALVTVHGSGVHGPWLVLFLLVLIWTADSGAYFAGRRWGQRKLASHVSPGKSWEGVAGALTLGGLFTLVAGSGFGYSGGALAAFLLLGLATVVVSVLGDLFESLVKRYCDVKDSGSLLPGHGGVLDRIDSLTAAAPFFAVGLAWLGGVR